MRSGPNRPPLFPASPHVSDNARSANAPAHLSVPLSLRRRLSQPDKTGRTGCPLFFPRRPKSAQRPVPCPGPPVRTGVFFRPVSTLTPLNASGLAIKPCRPALSDCGIRCRAFRQRPGRSRTTSGGNPKLEGRFRSVMLPLFRAAHGRCGATPEDGFAGVPRLLRKKQPKKRRAMTMTRAKTGIRVTKKAEPSGAFPMHPGIGTQKQAGPAALPSRDVSL